MSVFILASCSDKEDPIGYSDDSIKLSQKSLKFSAETDSAIISSEGYGWWVNNVKDNDSTYFPSIVYNLPFEPSVIKGNSFSVEHRGEKTLFIKMNKNDTGSTRELSISVQGGNYFDYIYISQSAE